MTTTPEVRRAWVQYCYDGENLASAAEFDAWLRTVKAAAWQEAFTAAIDGDGEAALTLPTNPYRP